jgi:hypothetical protein
MHKKYWHRIRPRWGGGNIVLEPNKTPQAGLRQTPLHVFKPVQRRFDRPHDVSDLMLSKANGCTCYAQGNECPNCVNL